MISAGSTPNSSSSRTWEKLMRFWTFSQTSSRAISAVMSPKAQAASCFCTSVRPSSSSIARSCIKVSRALPCRSSLSPVRTSRRFVASAETSSARCSWSRMMPRTRSPAPFSTNTSRPRTFVSKGTSGSLMTSCIFLNPTSLWDHFWRSSSVMGPQPVVKVAPKVSTNTRIARVPNLPVIVPFLPEFQRCRDTSRVWIYEPTLTSWHDLSRGGWGWLRGGEAVLAAGLAAFGEGHVAGV